MNNHIDVLYSITAQSLGWPETEDNYFAIKGVVDFLIDHPDRATVFLPNVMKRRDVHKIIINYKNLTNKISKHEKALKILRIIL